MNIKDKVARLSFIALLVTMTSAMFYAPTVASNATVECQQQD